MCLLANNLKISLQMSSNNLPKTCPKILTLNKIDACRHSFEMTSNEDLN